MTPIVFDIETYALDDAAQYLEPVKAARNLKDPEKIAADIEQRTRERDSKIALDWNVARIAVLAWWTSEHGDEIAVGTDDLAERRALMQFWREAEGRRLVGFNCKGFDLPFLIQRSRLLHVHYPAIDLGRYTRTGVVDLYLDLTFNQGTYDQGAMRRTLQAFCRRFGIVVPETVDSADVPALAARGEWAQVIEHAKADLAATVALARRLGVVAAERPTDGSLVTV